MTKACQDEYRKQTYDKITVQKSAGAGIARDYAAKLLAAKATLSPR